jgi:hypothetical protein
MGGLRRSGRTDRKVQVIDKPDGEERPARTYAEMAASGWSDMTPADWAVVEAEELKRYTLTVWSKDLTLVEYNPVTNQFFEPNPDLPPDG